VTLRIQVTNMKELVSQLDGLESDMKGKIIQAAMLDGAKLLQTSAKAHAPLRTGRFMSSIRSRRLKKKEFRGSDEIGAVVDFNPKIARYAYIVEGGAKAHTIKPKNKKALKFRGAMLAKVKHPGTRGKDVLRRTALLVSSGVQRVIGESITKRLAKIISKRGLK